MYNNQSSEEKYFWLKNRLSKPWKDLFYLIFDSSYTMDDMRPMLFNRFGDCIPEHICELIFNKFETLTTSKRFEHELFYKFIDDLENENRR